MSNEKSLKLSKGYQPKTVRFSDAKGYNPEASLPQKENSRYVVSPQSQRLFDKVLGQHKQTERKETQG